MRIKIRLYRFALILMLIMAPTFSHANPSYGDYDTAKVNFKSYWFRVESAIEEAYNYCRRSYNIGNQWINLSIPFAQNRERFKSQDVFLGGKGDPHLLWWEISRIIQSADFQDYVRVLSFNSPKIIEFNLKAKSWRAFVGAYWGDALISINYPGSREVVYIFKVDSKVTSVDIYNYLYCVASVGLDCSGFVYYIQKSIAKEFDIDLDSLLAKRLNRIPENVSYLVGLNLYALFPAEFEVVKDTIKNLRPGDIFLFRGRNARFRHSAVIQSVDYTKGEIRYLQCTDWAPQSERGVHESYIYFNPDHPEYSLSHPSVKWTQGVYPTFVGEPGLIYWKNDGDRYRSYKEYGGSIIVRPLFIKKLIESRIPQYYR